MNNENPASLSLEAVMRLLDELVLDIEEDDEEKITREDKHS